MAAQKVVERLQRQWQILAALRARRTGATAGTLGEEIGCSRATLYRDLKILLVNGSLIS